MKQLAFTIDIAATPETVWAALWNDANYRRWTSVWGSESRAISDWQEGGQIQFLGDEDSGMYAIIERLHPCVQMTFRHQGEIKAGKLEPATPESGWANAEESYFLTPTSSGTTLRATLETLEAWEGFMSEKFPLALAIVKDIAEGR